MEIEFIYDEKNNSLVIKPKEDNYRYLTMISNIDWTSNRATEDLNWAQRCKAGNFISPDGDTFFICGFEGSSGEIEVSNNDKAYLVDSYDHEKEPYLIMELDELIDFITQLRNFLITIGK